MSPPKDKIIEPIPDTVDNVVAAMMKPAIEKDININKLSSNTSLQPATPAQGVFDLGVEVERDVNGIEMGVLENGIPFLTQRGLIDIVGVSRKEIYEITQQWEDHYDDAVLTKDRLSFIKEYLFSRGYKERKLYIETRKDGTPHYAYPDIVCMAILEYYAFEAKSKSEKAVQSFRKFATHGLQRFIYDSLGYSPDQRMLESWRHFHDRLDMTLDSVPAGFFSVFREIASMLVPMIRAGIIISDKVVPDISAGLAWSSFWKENNLSAEHGERTKYDHDYPLYYPQAKSNPQACYAYPDSALGIFRAWLRQHYITTKFPNYLMGQTKLGKLPAKTATKVLDAFVPKQIEKK